MRLRTLPALVAVLFGVATISACSDAATGPVTVLESASNTEGQGYGNAEGQGYGNVEGQGYGNVEGQGYGNVVADSTARAAEGQGYGN